MKTMVTSTWHETNQRYLSTAVDLVKQTIEHYIARVRGETEAEAQPLQRQTILKADASRPPALLHLCEVFHLSSFEQAILLLCAGIELSSACALLCATAHSVAQVNTEGDNKNTLAPTFGLALAALPEAHWDALTPTAPLRYWRLIEIASGNTLTRSSLYIDECILHYLTGIDYYDERLAGNITPLTVSGDCVPSQHKTAEQIVLAWSHYTEQLSAKNTSDGRLPVVELTGTDRVGKHTIAAAACHTLGLSVSCISVTMLPTAPAEISAFLRLWGRTAILNAQALLLDCEQCDMTDPGRVRAMHLLMLHIQSPLLISSREHFHITEQQLHPMLTFAVQKPEMEEQRLIWQEALGNRQLNGHIEALVSQFNLSTAAIRTASIEVLKTQGEEATDTLKTLLWDACRVQARSGLDQLALRIDATATWDDLILPEPQRQMLQEIVAHVRQRTTVYETWGFKTKGARGLGISALFAGASGTGKTLAAEVLANQLHLDLYRIDLSAVVSKYIGETEKNLRHIFDSAEEGGTILLFDEADALFGKRSEVKESHDRHANIEVSYLLQRMEAYRGLAILTTNFKNAIDTAFMRRIRFIINFPFPDVQQRSAIWRHIFPQQLPTEGLDVQKLAQLNVAGGTIRNIALHAAFLAADANEPVRMSHLLQAASSECTKLEKPLTNAETRGWI